MTEETKQSPIPENVIADVKEERLYQLERGRAGKLPNDEGGPPGWSYEFDDKNTVSDWQGYITKYNGHSSDFAQRLSSQGRVEQFRKHMIKVAALELAAAEACDRNNALPPRHFDPPQG